MVARIGKLLAVALVLILICSSAFLHSLYCGFWGFLSFAVNSVVKKILVTNKQTKLMEKEIRFVVTRGMIGCEGRLRRVEI